MDKHPSEFSIQEYRMKEQWMEYEWKFSSEFPPRHQTEQQIAFVSGHTDITHDEFQSLYVPALDAALDAGHGFIMGSSPGCDQMAIQYLREHGCSNLIVTTYPNKRLKLTPTSGNLGGNQVVVRRWKCWDDKDADMTLRSDYDIAFPRTEEQQRSIYGPKYRHRVSGTQRNIDRRTKRK